MFGTKESVKPGTLAEKQTRTKEKIGDLLNHLYQKLDSGEYRHIPVGDLTKIHGVSNLFSRALVTSNIIKKGSKPGYYIWLAGKAPDEALADFLIQQYRLVISSYGSYNKKSRKKAAKKAAKRAYKRQSVIGLTNGDSSQVIDRRSADEYFEVEFELLRCYIKLDESDKATEALAKLRNKVNKLCKKLS